MSSLQTFAQIVDNAALNAQAIPQLSLQSSFTEKEAYTIQATSLEQRYKRGEQLIGLKLGFTSKAKMIQMGVHDMIWGRLTDAMLLQDGDSLDLDKFIHPRAEPEICFLVKKKIDRPLNLAEAKDHIESVAGAIEIIDSRYQNFKFSLEDVIADNCSSAAFVVGAWHSKDLAIEDLKMTMEINGQIIHAGSSSAILGNPWESVVAASRLAHQYGEVIEAGFYIMAGAATPAVYLERGQEVKVGVENLGAVSLSVG